MTHKDDNSPYPCMECNVACFNYHKPPAGFMVALPKTIQPQSPIMANGMCRKCLRRFTKALAKFYKDTH